MERHRSHTDWQRLGDAVRARRNHLGLAQGEGGGPSAATWRKVEKALEYPYADRTVSAICRTLGWPPDAFDQLLDGADPATLVDPTEPAEQLDAAPWQELLEGQRQINATLRDLVDELRRQREDEAHDR